MPKMSNAERAEAIKKAVVMRANGQNLREIAEHFGVSMQAVQKWEQRSEWAEYSASFLTAKSSNFEKYYNEYIEEFKSELKDFQYKQKMSAHLSIDISNKIDFLILSMILESQQNQEKAFDTLKKLKTIAPLITANSHLKRQTGESIDLLLGLDAMLGEIGEDGLFFKAIEAQHEEENKKKFTPIAISFS